MDMGDTMTMGGAPSDWPLNATGLDLTNADDAATFLGQILDDTVFQIDGNMYARYFWYGVCAVISVCAVFNAIQKVTFNLRMRAAAVGKSRPAKPSNLFAKGIATMTAIAREGSYAQWTPRNSTWFKVPPTGTLALLSLYFVYIILLEFVNNDLDGAQHFTSLAVRAAWLAVAQIPLLILLAGKNNLIGLVSGVSYERLNVLHRWVARVLFFLVTLHVIFLHLSWNAYDLGPLEYATDSCIPTGWAVYAILIWMNISTIAPIRNFSYEFFVLQHILTFFGFIIAVMMHLPSTALYSRVYIYIPIALYILDRLVRSARYAWNNARPGNATLEVLEGGVTKIRVHNKAIKTWGPGSHVFLSVPRFGLNQSHPATIASTPTSHGGDLVFILKGHRGFTSRLLRTATKSSASLKVESTPEDKSHLALLDGPYGDSHSDFAAFDSVLLLSGSTGITFTLSVLLNISARAPRTKLPVKRISFLWIIKNTSWTSWVSSELTAAFECLSEAGIELDLRIHVTCDDAFTDMGPSASKEDGCACDDNNGPCCCVQVSDSDNENEIREVDEKATSSSNSNSSKKASSITQVNVLSRSLSNNSDSSESNPKSGRRSSALSCARFYSGRPDIDSLLWDVLEKAEGETGVGVCGPLGLNADVRRTVVRISDERAVHKGSGAQGVYLHSECFGW